MQHIEKSRLVRRLLGHKQRGWMIGIGSIACVSALSASPDDPELKIYNTGDNLIHVWLDHSLMIAVEPGTVMAIDVSKIQEVLEHSPQLCVSVEEVGERITARNVLVAPVDLNSLQDVQIIWGSASVEEDDFESIRLTTIEANLESAQDAAWLLSCDHAPGKPSAWLVRPSDENDADHEVSGEFLFVQADERSFFCNEVGMVFFSIPSGSFANTDRNRKRIIEVTQDYYISTTEVTKGQYAQLVKGSSPDPAEINFPMTDVKWNEAMSFCEALSSPSEFQYNLPTEAQWERASRGGQGTPFSPGAVPISKIMWYAKNSGQRVHQVAGRLPNTFGLYDMHGNVREWCRDWYSVNGYLGKDPFISKKPFIGGDRVRRGGAYDTPLRMCTSDLRDGGHPSIRVPWQGFRVVLERKDVASHNEDEQQDSIPAGGQSS